MASTDWRDGHLEPQEDARGEFVRWHYGDFTDHFAEIERRSRRRERRLLLALAVGLTLVVLWVLWRAAAAL